MQKAKAERGGESGQQVIEYVCFGIGSKQRNSSKHILFLDLDDTTLSEAKSIAKDIIAKDMVSDIYIINSSGDSNYHLVCFDLFDFDEVLKIISRYKTDRQWLRYRKKSKDFVIRISPKIDKNGEVKDLPNLACIVRSPYAFRPKSNSARLVFQNAWGLKIKKDKKFNKSEIARLHVYRTRIIKKK